MQATLGLALGQDHGLAANEGDPPAATAVPRHHRVGAVAGEEEDRARDSTVAMRRHQGIGGVEHGGPPGGDPAHYGLLDLGQVLDGIDATPAPGDPPHRCW